MASISCLGFFIAPVIITPSFNSTQNGLQDAVFHRGRCNIHIVCSNYERVGDLAENQSKYLGPLIGDIGSVSEPITLKALQKMEKKIYLRIFYVHPSMRTGSFVHGFVFARQDSILEVRHSFHLANIALKQIPSYDPSHFLGVRQIEDIVQPTANEEDNRRTVPGCKTKLMDHQMKAIKFIQQSESDRNSTPQEIWNDPDNRWVHRVFQDAVQKGYLRKDIKFDAKGCILADDMGLGKTLTTLSAIQLSSEDALKFSRQAPKEPNLMPTSATLIICPLSTLENWKNEINIHFIRESLPFKTFYGRDKCTIEFKDIAQVAVVLATYESVVTQIKSSQEAGSSNATEGRKMGLDFSSIKWFRIVLDEAHYLKDPRTNRSSVILGLEAERRLCLTGTPLQNQLGDLHSLMKFIRIEPWTENSIWKNCIESPVEMCDPRGISTLQTIMNRISMRRLKTTLLSLPEKLETIINLQLKNPWNETYEKNHKAFSEQFGKNRTGGQGWNSSSFFADLVDLRQLCNHPALTEKGIGRGKYSWNESSKIVHLVQDLKLFLASGTHFRAVIFSEFKRFLEIIEVALNEVGIYFTTHYGKTENDTRRKNLERFRGDPRCKVLLATIKTAGVGIDLRCAQKVYIMEPTWNPAVEEQAIDRLYRIGQEEKVHVVRYCVTSSIEGHIFQIKRRKAELTMLSVPLSGNLEFEMVKKLLWDDSVRK